MGATFFLFDLYIQYDRLEGVNWTSEEKLYLVCFKQVSGF